MSVEQAIRKMLNERATLPIGASVNYGDMSQPKQGNSQETPYDEEDENAPGTTTAKKIGTTGLPIGQSATSGDGAQPPQGSSGNVMPETPAPTGTNLGADSNGQPPQGASGIKAPGLFDSVQITGKDGKTAKMTGADLAEAFTKKHFIATAELLNSISDHKQRNAIGAKHIEMFKKDNPRFDEGKFKKAAGMDAASQQAESVRTTELKESIAALFTGQENLAEGFLDKATSLFEAAVIGRVNAEMIKVNEELEAMAEQELTTLKTALSEQVNSYATQMVNVWIKENQLAIDQGLKQEVSESFMSGLRNLFAEHYIDVPENKVDVLESLTKELETSKKRINEEANKTLKVQKELTDLKKQAVVAEASKGMTAVDADRLLTLVEGIEFDSPELYTEKVAVIKESHFKKTAKKSAEVILAESTGGNATEEVVDPSIQRVVAALNRGNSGNVFTN
jgi:hypothetical protein